ncbi:MAG TPA: polysaccharide deacetylase family protein [Chryseosolibacter sp.]
MKTTLFVALLSFVLLLSCSGKKDLTGNTEITAFKNGKTGAISITLDDASINQFRQALPIMDTLDIKATFFINTAHIRDNQIPPKYFGRPVAEIIKETATTPTNQSNIFERASALRFLDMPGAVDSHNNAGALYENEKYDEAFKTIDEAYAKARSRKIKAVKASMQPGGDMITWAEIKAFAANGHEFGSHTISHPRLSVLDEPNLLYELEKCKEEIQQQLGPHHTFSAECPFGTENERVMEYAYKVYPALRNRMPEPFLAEINRGSDKVPGMFHKPYIQWQRGPLAKTTMSTMKSWVDTLLVRNNVWLVLTFHGVDGIGWEAKPHEELKEYFSYMKGKEDKLWIATFGDVTKYMRERMAAKVSAERKDDNIIVTIGHSLDKALYDFPLTLKTYVPGGWSKVKVTQDGAESEVAVASDEHGSYAQYQALPNAGDVTLSEM